MGLFGKYMDIPSGNQSLQAGNPFEIGVSIREPPRNSVFSFSIAKTVVNQ